MVLVLSACASPYSDEGITGGYSAQQLEPGVWRVGFSGNGFTSRETVQSFWLYRCAELTLEQGYEGFEIVTDLRLVSNEQTDSDDPLLVPVKGGTYMYVPIYIQDTAKPYLVATIRLLKKPFTPEAPKSFDAAALKSTLEPIVKGKLCDGGNVCPHPHTYLLPQKPIAPAQSG
jgi:hypothetical protein